MESEDSFVGSADGGPILFASVVADAAATVVLDGGFEKLERLILHGVEAGSPVGPEFGVR